MLFCLEHNSELLAKVMSGSTYSLSSWIADFPKRICVDTFKEAVAIAVRFALHGIQKYPVVCSTLGLANSWEKLIGKLMGVNCIFPTQKLSAA